MADSIDTFFSAYVNGTLNRSVYHNGIPKETVQSEVDKDGWFEWKIIPGTLSTEDYKKIAKRFNATLPENFIEWHKRYFFFGWGLFDNMASGISARQAIETYNRQSRLAHRPTVNSLWDRSICQ